MNKVLLIGRITKDPESRYSQNGIQQVQFSLAVDRGIRDNNGNRQADFISCVAWRGQAEFISRYIRKGYLMSIEGRISTRNYQGQDGQMRYVTEVVVDQVENLTPRQDDGQQNMGYQQPVQPQPQQTYQGYNTNPSYGTPYQQSVPQQSAPQSFNVDVADDDLPF